MKPILYEFNETSFLTNGLGRLSNAISCYVEEAKNGIYELTMVYPVTGVHYADLKEGRLIYARHDDTPDRQPFRIYRISRPLNGRVEVSAHHRTYDLNKIILMPCSASSASAAMTAIEDNAAVSNGFTFWTDSVTSADWQVDVPSTVRSVLGGVRGSILDVYGGEFEWDDTIVKLHASRGQNTDVVISYGKNMTNIKYDTDDSDIWTGIVPFWRGNNSNDVETTVTLTEKVVYSSYRGNFQEDRYIPVDFSTEFETMPTEAELRAKAESYVAANARPAIPASIDVSFIQLWQTEEYKTFAPLERLKLCDTVTIRHEVLGVEASGKIVKTKYDVLMERYASMTIGETRTNLASNIQRSISDAMQDVSDRAVTNSMMQAAIDHATDLLRGGLGGHVVINTNANGEPNEILVMDTDDIGTAVNVMRINVNGIGFSSNGYNGPYTSAWTLDGHFVADFITAGTMLANRIKGGTLSLGGVDNGNGVLHVYDASGNLIGKWDKDGADITGNLTLKNENVTAAISSVVGFLWSTSGSAEYVHQVRAYAFKLNGNSWGNNSSTRARSNAYAFVANDMLQLYKEVTQSAVSEYFNNQPDRSFITKKGTNYSFLMEYSTPGQYLLCNKTVSIPSGFNGKTDYSDKYVNKIDSYTLFMVDDCIGIGSGLSRNSTSGSSTYVGGDDNLQVDSNKSFFYISPDYGGIHMEAIGGGWAIIKGGLQIFSGSFLRLGNTINSEALINTSFEMSRQTFRVQTSSGGWSTVQYASSSSKRYKHDIAALTDEALDPHKLYDLHVRQFTYNEDVPVQYEDMRDQALPGFIAEEVAEIYPAAVIHRDGEIESWDERRIIPGMLSLIQEQKKQIDDLQARVDRLEAIIARLGA